MKQERTKAWLPIAGSPQERVMRYFHERYAQAPDNGRFDVTINFHPDRRNRVGIPILECLRDDGVVKSQFETKTSNGGLTAYRGGDRWMWEHKAFAGIYDDVAASERPKYGALNHRCLGSGGSPRFGSAFLRLEPHILARTTFCYPDSYFNPEAFGIGTAVHHLIHSADVDDRDALDNYIEAHIHGPIDLDSDVQAIVLDPVFKGSAIEDLARKLPCDVEWHKGFRLHVSVAAEHPEYRGLVYVELARHLAHEGFIDPIILGEAVESGGYDPQQVKKVWHYLARFGDLNKQAEQDASANGATHRP